MGQSDFKNPILYCKLMLSSRVHFQRIRKWAEPCDSEIPSPFELLLLEYSMTSPRSGQVQLQHAGNGRGLHALHLLRLEKSYRYLSLNLFSIVPCLCQYWPFFCIVVYYVTTFHARRSLALVFIVRGKQAHWRERGSFHRHWSHVYHVYIL